MAKNQTAVSNEEAVKENLNKEVEKGTLQERKFPLEALRGNCMKLFGCTSSTFDGAFFYVDREKLYTIPEAKTIIQQWKGKGIGK